MAKGALTKSEMAAKLAEEIGITKKQVNQFFEALSKLAYREAKNTFVIPGLGKMVLVLRAAREMKISIGPKAGQIVKVPAKKVLKFRFAKAAKDAVLGIKK
jgi:DNA-binding protein HU-beta